VDAVAKDLMMRTATAKTTTAVRERVSGSDERNSDNGVGESSTSSGSQERRQQQQQEFVNDSDALVAELVEVSRGAQRAENKIVELSALSSMFANVVSKQSQQIEQIYTEALKTTKFLETGNVEMRKTISRRRSGSNYMAFVLFIATFAVLFLDWFND
jgi:syntaxin 18